MFYSQVILKIFLEADDNFIFHFQFQAQGGEEEEKGQ